MIWPTVGLIVVLIKQVIRLELRIAHILWCVETNAFVLQLQNLHQNAYC